MGRVRQTPPRSVAVLYHPKKPATRIVAEEACEWLGAQNVSAWLGDTWDEATVRAKLPEVDLIVVMGGDGSMLRAARMAAEHGVALMGVNMGRLGFLSEMTPENWKDILPRVLAGEAWIELRMMLRARTLRGGKPLSEHLALNDIVISRGTLARMVRLATQIDGDQLATYNADGLILSTPTGSTAYSLAAGGPILPPELHNILVVPIAPHLSLNRPIVLSQGAVIQVTIGTDHQAILTVDGQSEVDLEHRDVVEVSASPHTSRFARVTGQTYFYHTLLDRLGIQQVYPPDRTDSV